MHTYNRPFQFRLKMPLKRSLEEKFKGFIGKSGISDPTHDLAHIVGVWKNAQLVAAKMEWHWRKKGKALIQKKVFICAGIVQGIGKRACAGRIG